MFDFFKENQELISIEEKECCPDTTCLYDPSFLIPLFSCIVRPGNCEIYWIIIQYYYNDSPGSPWYSKKLRIMYIVMYKYKQPIWLSSQTLSFLYRVCVGLPKVCMQSCIGLYCNGPKQLWSQNEGCSLPRPGVLLPTFGICSFQREKTGTHLSPIEKTPFVHLHHLFNDYNWFVSILLSSICSCFICWMYSGTLFKSRISGSLSCMRPTLQKWLSRFWDLVCYFWSYIIFRTLFCSVNFIYLFTPQYCLLISRGAHVPGDLQVSFRNPVYGSQKGSRFLQTFL